MARDVHWELLNDPEVVSVAEAVATRAAAKNEGVLELDDLLQEALMLVASKPQLQRLAWDEEYSLLHYVLTQDLFNGFIRPLLRSGAMDAMRYKHVPTEEEHESTEPYVMFDTGTGDYTVDAVKLLLPAVWDESYCYGLPRRDDAPDPDMPRSAGNKAQGNNLSAYIADIKTGWKEALLTKKERATLLLLYGMGWTQEQVAGNQMVSQQMISTRAEKALNKIVARLNGGHWKLTESTTE